VNEPFWVYSTVILIAAWSLVREIPRLLRAGFWGIAVLLIASIALPSLLALSDAGPWTVGTTIAVVAGGYLLARFSSTCPRCRMPLRDLRRAGSHLGRSYEVVEGRRCRSCGYAVYGNGAALHDELAEARKSYDMDETWREKAPELITRIEAAGGEALVDEFVEWCRQGGLREVPDEKDKQQIVVNEFLRQRTM
jgi:hypothetical protein